MKYFANLAAGVLAGVVVGAMVQLGTHSIELGWAAGLSLFAIYRGAFHAADYAADRITKAIKRQW